MPRYTVQHRYAASRDGQTFGPWEPDTEVDLDEPDAEWVNRDSAGTLEPVDQGDDPDPEPTPDPDPEPVVVEPAEPATTQRPRGRSKR